MDEIFVGMFTSCSICFYCSLEAFSIIFFRFCWYSGNAINWYWLSIQSNQVYLSFLCTLHPELANSYNILSPFKPLIKFNCGKFCLFIRTAVSFGTPHTKIVSAVQPPAFSSIKTFLKSMRWEHFNWFGFIVIDSESPITTIS